MRVLDRKGYIYTVYDLENGSVLKKEKPWFLQRFLHSLHGHSAEYIREHLSKARILAEACKDKELLGNPKFIKRNSYTQDKTEVLGPYVNTHSFTDGQKVIDAYIKQIFTTWQNGFSDIIFNWTRNCGMLSSGRVILFDFNEVTFHKEEIRKLIDSKRWLRAYSYTLDLRDVALKDYYAQAMEKAMTLENLDKYWKDNEQLLAQT